MDGIAERFPAVEIVRLRENVGFAKGNNLGFTHVKDAHWTVLLNPDAIPHPDWLMSLVDSARQNPAYSFFSCKMINALSTDMMDGAGDILHVSGLAWRRGHGLPVEKVADSLVEIFSACAGAAMYKSTAFKVAGGFDDGFFCYFEDVDLAFRLQLAGHRCLYVPTAVVAHVGSVTTGGKRSDFSVYHGHRNLVWTYFKNMPGGVFWACLPLHVMMNIVSVLVCVRRGQRRVILKSKIDALRGLSRVWRQRRAIQRSRVAAPVEIWRKLGKQLFR